MHRFPLALMPVVAIAGCAPSTPPNSIVTPLAAAPASADRGPDSSTPSANEAPSTIDQASRGAVVGAPERHDAAKPVIAGVPPVLLTSNESGLCKLGVGDELPAIELPKLGGGEGKLAELFGEQATVVLFWTPDPWMSRTALADLQRDVVDGADPNAVAVVGVIVGGLANEVQADVAKSGARFTQLIDQEGKTLAECGSATLPRVYVLTSDKKIAWFDIEYSETTRRELLATLAALAPSDS
jgi:hypothetical protein